MNNIETSQRGFTLIELLIVVSIIGILAAIVSAQYSKAIHRADIALCQHNLRTLYTGLTSYKMDYNNFPFGDGLADINPRHHTTGTRCSPAANGLWSGVSLLLVELGYCPEEAMYCPAIKRANSEYIEAYPGCLDSYYADREVPKWKFLRYAYNVAASDVGGADASAVHRGNFNVNNRFASDVWLVRCMHLDPGQYDRERDIQFPFYIEDVEGNSRFAVYGEFELTVLGEIRLRPMEVRKK